MAQRILLVEDDKYTRELYEDLLKGEGYDVTSAEDGELGFEKAIEGGFDLILLDIIMPKKDGVSFLKLYQTQQPTKPNGKIVMLTNLNDDSMIKSCFNLGAVGYLMKSELTPDQIIKETKNYLDKGNGSTPRVPPTPTNPKTS